MKIITRNDWAYLEGCTPPIQRIIDEVASFKPHGYWFSPKFKQGFWDGVVRFREYDRTKKCYRIPAGFTDRICMALDVTGVPYELEDFREIDCPEPLFELADGKALNQGKWRHQGEALEQALAHGRGILKLPTAAGKTIIGAAIIASYGEHTVWLTDRRALMYQTKEVLENALEEPIGVLGDQEEDIQRITVATVQTLHSKKSRANIRALFANTRLLILDEAHHLASGPKGNYWSKILRNFQAPYRFGLTASPCTSGSGLHLIGLVGEIIVDFSLDELIDRGVLVEPRVWTYQMAAADIPETAHYKTQYKKGVVENAERNETVAHIAYLLSCEKSPALTLVKQVGHGDALEAAINRRNVAAVFLSGKDSQERRNEVISALSSGEIDNIVATAQILGEGVDIPAIKAVINATGTRGGGSLASAKEDEVGRGTIQALGRALRSAPGKEYAEFIEICDPHPKSLLEASNERIQALRELVGDDRIKPWAERG